METILGYLNCIIHEVDLLFFIDSPQNNNFIKKVFSYLTTHLYLSIYLSIYVYL
jgi:hypothetical protein